MVDFAYIVFLAGLEHKVSHTVVPAWYHRPGYVKVMARLILTELLQFKRPEMAEGTGEEALFNASPLFIVLMIILIIMSIIILFL